MDDRIAKTLAKKTELLRVLEQPCVPLHNNAAAFHGDRGAAGRAQKRNRQGQGECFLNSHLILACVLSPSEFSEGLELRLFTVNHKEP